MAGTKKAVPTQLAVVSFECVRSQRLKSSNDDMNFRAGWGSAQPKAQGIV